MLQAWRIVKEKHASTAFDGEGARLFGGRWNSAGLRAVYASSSKSLAALETLVHLRLPLAASYVIIPIRFPEALLQMIPPRSLRAGWDAEPPSLASQQLGDEWLRSDRSAVLAVPSILTGETNYVLNPVHPRFKKIRIGKPLPFTFDPRLLA
jgi:RES domain-containing protein